MGQTRVCEGIIIDHFSQKYSIEDVQLIKSEIVENIKEQVKKKNMDRNGIIDLVTACL